MHLLRSQGRESVGVGSRQGGEGVTPLAWTLLSTAVEGAVRGSLGVASLIAKLWEMGNRQCL